MYTNCNTFYTKANMDKISKKITEEYKTEYYENRNSNFSSFEDFSDWYINKIINDTIIDRYENLTNTVCIDKYEEDDILDNVLSYVCDNVDGCDIESIINQDTYRGLYDYDSRAFF